MNSKLLTIIFLVVIITILGYMIYNRKYKSGLSNISLAMATTTTQPAITNADVNVNIVVEPSRYYYDDYPLYDDYYDPYYFWNFGGYSNYYYDLSHHRDHHDRHNSGRHPRMPSSGAITHGIGAMGSRGVMDGGHVGGSHH